jgi:hypothetical protein
MPGTHPRIPRLPAVLATRIAQADHLSRALQSLSGKAGATDPSALWIHGRADEVRTLVDEIAREWAAGLIGTAYACEAIQSYVGTIHVALHRRYGESGASCCGPHLEPFSRVGARRPIVRPVRSRLESGVDDLALEEPPASRVRSRSQIPAEERPGAAAMPAPRKSAG